MSVGSQTTVAIIEDDDNTREVFRAILEHQGHRVIEAIDGIEGLSLVRNELPDLVLLDLGLPGMDGKAVAAAIKADPRTAFVKIIVVTAALQRDTRAWAMDLGCNEAFEKPVGLRVLTDAVARCLRAT